jgi:hypothetical protein
VPRTSVQLYEYACVGWVVVVAAVADLTDLPHTL